MLKNTLSLAAAAALGLSLAACGERDEPIDQDVEEVGAEMEAEIDEVGDDMEDMADEAGDDLEEAGEEIEDEVDPE